MSVVQVGVVVHPRRVLDTVLTAKPELDRIVG